MGGCEPARCLSVLCLIPHISPNSSRMHTDVGDVHIALHCYSTAPACHPSRVAAVRLVQHVACKLREGAVMSAHCSEVVPHVGESVSKRD